MLGLQAFTSMVGHYLLSLTKLTYSLYPLKQEQRSKCMFRIQSITFIPFKPQFVQKVKISHSSLIILSNNLVSLAISRFSCLYILHIAKNFERHSLQHGKDSRNPCVSMHEPNRNTHNDTIKPTAFSEHNILLKY